MVNERDFFRDKKVDTDKLIPFGFKQDSNGYIYKRPILNGILELQVLIKGSSIFTNICDIHSNMDYCLHKIPGAEGEFVGKVRLEYEQILAKIRDKCFRQHIFTSRIALDIASYALENFGSELEFLWDTSPKAAVLRHKASQKWYAIFMKISARRLGICSDKEVEIINLKMEPEDIRRIIDNAKFFPAYHMNKKHWITACLSKIDNMTEILPLLSASYLSVS